MDKKAIQAGLQNIESAKKLSPECHGLIFAFDGLALDTTVEHMCAYLEERKGETAILECLPNLIVTLGKWVLVQVSLPDGGASYGQPEGSFEEQFLIVFSEIYYTLYGYARHLQSGDRQLPALADQGFKIEYGKVAQQFTVRPK